MAVSSLTDVLIKENLQIDIYSGKLSREFITSIPVNELKSNINTEEAENIFLKSEPDLLITGTSAGNSEQRLRNYAYSNGIKSFVILDFWKDYSRRWLYADYKIENMKDKVCVMDKLVRDEMIAEGFPEDNLIVTGHPYLDRIFNLNHQKPSGKENKNKYLYLSQPFDVIGIKDYKVHPLVYIADALKKIAIKKQEKLYLTIKLHPIEKLTEELNELVSEINDGNIQVVLIKNEKNIKELLDTSDTVIGFNTIAMFEARALQKKTYSLNYPNIKNSLKAAMATAGIKTVDIQRDDFAGLLMTEEEVKSEKKIFTGGIENCRREILRSLN